MPSVNTITLVFETQDGVKLNPISFKVKDGYSSYETWVQLPGNEGKSEQDFIDYLRYTIPVLQSLGQSTEGVMSQKASTDEFAKKTDKATKVNGKTLDKDIVLKAADVNALADSGGEVTGLVEIAFNGGGPKLVLHRPDSNDNVAMEFRGKNMSRWFGLGADGQLYLNAAPDINDADGAMIYTTKNRPAAGDLNAYTKTETDAKIKAATDPKFNKSDVDQATGTSTTKVMSQKASTDALNQKADKSTKVNGKPLSGDVQLAPGDVGTYSKEEIDSKLDTNVGNAVAKADVVQETGTSTTKIMSQKATTDQLGTKVDKTITVNGKGLDKDVNLVAGDVNAFTKQETNAELDKKLDRAQLKDAEGESPTDIMSQRAVTESLAGKVPNTRKVNGKVLSSDISLSATDVGAYSKAESNTEANKKVDKTAITQTTGTSTTQIPSQKLVTDELAKKVDKTTKVNGKLLTGDITLIAGDVGAPTKAEMAQAIQDAEIPVVQTTGNSTTEIMSQKAVTDNLSTKVDNTNGIYAGLQRNVFSAKQDGGGPPLVIRTPFDLTKKFSINFEFEGTGILGDTLDYSRVLIEISTMYGAPYLKATPITGCTPADAGRPPYLPMVKDNHLIIMFPQHGEPVDVQLNAFVNSYVVGNEADRLPDLTQNWSLEQLDEEWRPDAELTWLISTPTFKAENYAEDINNLRATAVSGWYSVGGDTEDYPFADGGLLQVIGTERGVNAMQFALGGVSGQYAYRISDGFTYGDWVNLPTSANMPTIESLGGMSAADIKQNFNGRQSWVSKIKTGTWSQLVKLYGDGDPATYLLTVQHMRSGHAVATQVAITVGNLSDRTADITQISGSADPEFPVSLRLEKDPNNPGAVVVSLLDEMGSAGITERYGVELWGSGQRVVYSNQISGNDSNALITLPINRYNGLAGNGAGLTGIRAIKGDSFNVGVYNSWVELCEFDIRPQTTTMIVDLIGGYSYGDDKANQNAKAQIILRAVNNPYNKPMGTIWYTSKDNHPVAEFGWLPVEGSTTRYRLFVKIQGTPVSMVTNIRSTDDFTVVNSKVSAEPAGILKGHQHEYFTTLNPPSAGEVGTYTKAEIDSMIQSTGGAAVAKDDILQTTGTATNKLMSQKATTDQLATKVPTSRKINGKALTADVSLVAADVNAYTKAETDTALGKKFDKTGGVVTGGVTAEMLTTKGAIIWEHTDDTGGTLIQLNATSQPGDVAEAFINWGGGNDAIKFLKGANPSDNLTDVYGQLRENNVRVYSPNNKPSPADIGTYSKAEIDGKVLWKDGTYVTPKATKWVQAGSQTTGFLPGASGVKGSGKSRLGTDGWWFEASYVDNMHAKTVTTDNLVTGIADVTQARIGEDVHNVVRYETTTTSDYAVIKTKIPAQDGIMTNLRINGRGIMGQTYTSQVQLYLSWYRYTGAIRNASMSVQGFFSDTSGFSRELEIYEKDGFIEIAVPTTYYASFSVDVLNRASTALSDEMLVGWTATPTPKADVEAIPSTTKPAVQEMYSTGNRPSPGDVGAYSKAEVDTKVGTAVPKTAVVQATGTSTTNIMSQKATTDQLAAKVPSTRKINGKPLSTDVTLSAADLNLYTKTEIDNELNRKFDKLSVVSGEGQAVDKVMHQKAVSDVLTGKVPTSRKVNGKTLTSDITITPTDLSVYTKAETDSKLTSKVNTSSVVQGVGSSTTNILSQKAVTDALALKVPTTRRINNKLLNADVTLVAGDVGAFKADGVTSIVPNQDAVQWDVSSGVYQATYGGATRTVLHFLGSGSCSATQLLFDYSNRGIWYRTSRDARGFEVAWTEIYTSASKPSPADIGAYTKAEVDSRINTRVPTTRKVNGKPLTGDITLTPADVGAYTKAEVDTKFNGLHRTWKFTAVGGETTLTPGFAFTKCILTVDGYFQPEGYSYSVTSNVITLGSALEAGELVELVVL